MTRTKNIPPLTAGTTIERSLQWAVQVCRQVVLLLLLCGFIPIYIWGHRWLNSQFEIATTVKFAFSGILFLRLDALPLERKLGQLSST